MADYRLSLFLVAMMVMSSLASPLPGGFGGYHHKHVLIHVPYYHHTVHHYHKVPVYIKSQHHYHHEPISYHGHGWD